MEIKILKTNSKKLILSCIFWSKLKYKKINKDSDPQEVLEKLISEKMEVLSNFSKNKNLTNELNINEIQFLRLWTYTLTEVLILQSIIIQKEIVNQKPMPWVLRLKRNKKIINKMIISLLFKINERQIDLSQDILRKTTLDFEEYIL